MVATADESVLLLGEDDTLRQLRPEDAAAREITALLSLASGDLLIGTRHRGLLVWGGERLVGGENGGVRMLFRDRVGTEMRRLQRPDRLAICAWF